MPFPSCLPLRRISCFDIYHMDSDNLNHAWLEEAFCDPVIQDITIGGVLRTDKGWYIEVGFKPGVTDNVGHSAQYAFELISGSSIKVFSARGYLLQGGLDLRCRPGNSPGMPGQFAHPHHQGAQLPRVRGHLTGHPHCHRAPRSCRGGNFPGPRRRRPLKLSQDRTLALSVVEMKAIINYLKDPDTLQKRSCKGSWGQDNGCRARVPGPDLVRALQAQDLQCGHHLRRGW